MTDSYRRMKNQLLSDTIPVTDLDSNEREIRQRSLTRPRVNIKNKNISPYKISVEQTSNLFIICLKNQI